MVTSEDLTLPMVLCDDKGVESFSKHLVREFSTENMDFYQIMSQFRVDCDPRGDGVCWMSGTELKESCDFIIDRFIRPGSMNEINIPSTMIKTILAVQSEGSYPTTMFDDAFDEIVKLMSRDSFQRFKSSRLCEDFLGTYSPSKSVIELARFVVSSKTTLSVIDAATGEVLLIEAGADINQATTDDACTPLIIAACEGHVEILSMLVVEGVDTEVRDSFGENALEAATDEGKLAEYEAAMDWTALAAAKLRFGRTLVEETIIPAMSAVNTGTNYGRDLSRITHRSVPASADLDAELFWRAPNVAELVFSFLDRHGLIDLE